MHVYKCVYDWLCVLCQFMSIIEKMNLSILSACSHCFDLGSGKKMNLIIRFVCVMYVTESVRWEVRKSFPDVRWLPAVCNGLGQARCTSSVASTVFSRLWHPPEEVRLLDELSVLKKSLIKREMASLVMREMRHVGRNETCWMVEMKHVRWFFERNEAC